MKEFKIKRTRSRVHHTRWYPLYAALCVVAAAAVAITWVTVEKNRAQAASTLARQEIALRIQSDLNEALRAFDQFDLPGVDVSGSILPTMRMHLYAAEALGSVLQDVYGEQMVDQATLQQIRAAVDEVDHRIGLGQSTTTARDTLAARLTEMETNLNARFAGSDLILPRTALK